MAVFIVDALEVIGIEHQERQRALVALAARDLAHQRVFFVNDKAPGILTDSGGSDRSARSTA